MLASYLIVLPVIDPEQGRECIRSMHHELQHRTLVVDNSPDGVTGLPPFTGDVYRRWQGVTWNLGFGRAVNVAAKRVLFDGTDWLLVCTATMRFGPEGGRDWIAQLDEIDGEPGALFGPGWWHTSAIARTTLETVGLFDGNYWPSYFEDTDYTRRTNLAGLDFSASRTIDASYLRSGHGYDALRSQRPGEQVIGFPALEAWYVSKWGGKPGEERFTTPFDSGKPLSYWPAASVAELVERYQVAV